MGTLSELAIAFGLPRGLTTSIAVSKRRNSEPRILRLQFEPQPEFRSNRWDTHTIVSGL